MLDKLEAIYARFHDLGVALTAALVGGFATWLMGLDWRLGLLLGGIIGSTDAAAVFNVIQGSGLRSPQFGSMGRFP